MIIALAAFTTGFAQENKNEKKETVVTKTAVKDSKGMETASKSVTKTEKQVVGLESEDANQTNQEMVMRPVEIDTSVDYSMDGTEYTFTPEKKGYRLVTANNDADSASYAVIRPTTQKGYYIMSQDGNSSFGYFNKAGDFVVESYDAATDSNVSTVYELKIKDKKVMKKEKM